MGLFSKILLGSCGYYNKGRGYKQASWWTASIQSRQSLTRTWFLPLRGLSHILFSRPRDIIFVHRLLFHKRRRGGGGIGYFRHNKWWKIKSRGGEAVQDFAICISFCHIKHTIMLLIYTSTCSRLRLATFFRNCWTEIVILLWFLKEWRNVRIGR